MLAIGKWEFFFSMLRLINTYSVFHNCWNKAAVLQIFPVDFILFSNYCWEIVNILIYSIKYCKIMPWMMEQKIFCVNTYYETKPFKIVQPRYRRKFNYNTFPNRRQIFKLVKNFEAHSTCEDSRTTGSLTSGPPITIRTPRRNVHSLSINLYTKFNSASNQTADIWSTYSRAPLDILGSYLKLNGCRS